MLGKETKNKDELKTAGQKEERKGQNNPEIRLLGLQNCKINAYYENEYLKTVRPEATESKCTAAPMKTGTSQYSLFWA